MHGQTVLITGASSGIGAAFAEELATLGNSLILVARTEATLVALAEKLRQAYGVAIEVIALDLAKEGAPEQLFAECSIRGLQVDVLINNAGFGSYGIFEKIDPMRLHAEVMLNAVAVLDLTRLFLPSMLRKGNGAVINVASTAAFQPDPYMAVYGATKAFVLSFTEALWEENRQRGIQCLALCPGPTETAFFTDFKVDSATLGKRDTPELVVKEALKALAEGKPFIVPGSWNVMRSTLPRFVSRRRLLTMAGHLLRPKGFAEHDR